MSKAMTRSHSPGERRRSPRSEAVNRIDYKVLIPEEGEGFTQNISHGGFALFLDKEVPPGAVLELSFPESAPDSPVLRSIVKVVWRKDHLAGVKILGR